MSERMFAVAVVSVLALAMGAQVASFSVVDALMLNPLPVRSPGQLVRITAREKISGRVVPWSYPDYRELRAAGQSVFSGVTVFATRGLILRHEGHAINVRAAEVSGDFFSVFGIDWVQKGRLLERSDDTAASPMVAIATETLSRKEFGGDAVGRRIWLNDRSFTIVGVIAAPEIVQALRGPGLFVPAHTMALAAVGNRLEDRGARWATVFARLRAGERSDRLAVLLSASSARLAEASHGISGPLTIAAEPAGTYLGLAGGGGQDLAEAAKLVWVLSLLLLVVALGSCANLFLVRATRNIRNLCIRVALGAGMWRMAVQAFAEALVLSALAGVASLVVAQILLDCVSRVSAFSGPPPRVDFLVAIYVGALVAAATLAFAVIPLAVVWRGDPIRQLRVREAWQSRSGVKLRYGLVIGQVAIAVALLVSTALLIRTIRALNHVDVGFRASNLLAVALDFRQITGSLVRPPQESMLASVQARVQGLPGVVSVSFADQSPFDGNQVVSSVDVLGHASASTASVLTVASGYFQTLGIPVMEGRAFDEVESGSRRVAVINGSFARQHWPGLNPVGRTVSLSGEPLTVVGVVGDVREVDPSLQPEPSVFVRYPDRASSYVQVLVRLREDAPADTPDSVRQAISRGFPGTVIASSEALEERVGKLLKPRRDLSLISAAFGLFALVIASIGLSSVTAYEIATRQREFGVRLACGATPAGLFGRTLRGTVMLAGVGIAVGALLGIAAGRSAGHWLYGVGALDVPSVAVAALLAFLFALFAGALPASRVVRLDPSKILREE